MGKKDEYGNRSTKKDKKKNTFKKFGKATSRGVRFAEEQKANTLNKKEKNVETRLTKKEKKNKKYFKS
jgi:hypothetical protein